MITVQFEKTGEGILRLTAAGHAGAGPRGADPICAAVTALCYTLAQALQLQRRQLAEDPHIRIREGAAELTARPIPEGAAEVTQTFWVVWTGLKLLEHNYPENLKIQQEEYQ